MAIGAVVFAVIITWGPAHPRRDQSRPLLRRRTDAEGIGGKALVVAQPPAYLIGEFALGTLGGPRRTAIGRVRADAPPPASRRDPDKPYREKSQ